MTATGSARARVGLTARQLCTATVLAVLPATVHAQDSAYARGLAAACTNCHTARAAGPGAIPAIAGRDKNELFKLLADFKSGARSATVMHQLARGFSDEQLGVLAGYFSATGPGSVRARD